MLKFSPLQLEDRQNIDEIMQKDGTISSIRTFSSLYIWGEHYQTCLCIYENIVFLKACFRDDLLIYYMPLGENIQKAVEIIEQDARDHGMEYEITLISKQDTQDIEKAFSGKFDFVEQREEHEYIYNAVDLITLKGKKYHSKRNYINRFMTEYAGRWDYSPVDPVADYDEILDFSKDWWENHENDENQEDYKYEYSAIVRALKYFNELNVVGGKITVDGIIIAFTLATPQNSDVIDILIEKANPSFEGAYQMINNEFAKTECQHYKYINREEDMGIEGLRQAKLSYHPAFLSEKYKAVPRK